MEAVTVAKPPDRDAGQTPRPPARLPVLSSAEVAECTCPEPCERDHELD